MTASINQSQNPSHHLLASRALVRTRLQTWDAALLDAERVNFTLFTRTMMLTLLYTKALKIKPSLIAYIAKSLAHVGNGERDKGYRACDIAFERFHSSHVTFLLLIKVCVFVLGFLILLTSPRPLSCLWRESASMRSHAWTTLSLLSGTTQFVMSSRCVHNVSLRVEYYRRRFEQAYMYLLLGNSCMESSDYEGAIKSFELARAQLRPFPSQSLFVVALVNFLTSVL